jgi:hypothetical protein
MVSLHFIDFNSWGVLDNGPLYCITLWAQECGPRPVFVPHQCEIYGSLLLGLAGLAKSQRMTVMACRVPISVKSSDGRSSLTITTGRRP